MNAKLTYYATLLAALLAASTAFAAEGEPGYPSATGPDLSRAAVKAETRAAIANHQIARNDADAERLAVADWNRGGTWLTRADVRVDTAAAVAAHQIARNDAEFERIAMRDEAIDDPMPRVQVAAETREAERLGLIPRGELTVVATQAQLEAVQRAGERALQQRAVAAAR